MPWRRTRASERQAAPPPRSGGLLPLGDLAAKDSERERTSSEQWRRPAGAACAL